MSLAVCRPPSQPRWRRLSALVLPCTLLPLVACDGPSGSLDVYPGDDLQASLDLAADSGVRRVIVHAGTYRPPEARQALIWFTRDHEGLRVEAEGDVTLTAANPDIADPHAPSYPAVVNHVVYFGDGIGPSTVLRGFAITGANGFVTREPPEIQPEIRDVRIDRTDFFYSDGGAIKVFGRSYPTLERLEIRDNYASPCGAGISIEHRGFLEESVTIRDCVFRRNRSPLTGVAIDLLGQDLGSAAVIENCLFVGNLANEPHDDLSRRLGTWKHREGHGAITVFAASRAVVRDCTFVDNRNGVDDGSARSRYERNLFWRNDAPGGWPRGERYEIDAPRTPNVVGCVIGGRVPQDAPWRDRNDNVIDPEADPEFDESWVPRNPVCRGVGYRPPR